MTNKKTTKRALVMSVLSLVLCVSMFVGTTFAWFTDEVVSSNNIIKSGSLDVKMLWSNDKTNWTDASTGAIFDYKYWEPGYTDVKYIKIENVGDLALKFRLDIIPNVLPTAGTFNLADVIDVYMFDASATVDRAAIDAATPVGTLANLITAANGAANGTLLPADGVGSNRNNGIDAPKGEITYCIVLKMQESADNNYQNLSVGDGFRVQLLATQYTWEEDNFNDQYDTEAELDWTPVSNANELRLALEREKDNILLTKDIATDAPYTIDYDVNINGNGKVIYRNGGTATVGTDGSTPAVFTGTMFTVKTGTTLTLEDVIVDGGAVWTGPVNDVLKRGTVNSGITATGAIITTEGTGIVELKEGAILQNNDGANAVSLSTRTGSKLIIDGGEIINNHAAAGAIWGGGEIIFNSGKISYNHGGIGGAIRVVTNVGTVLTMNGGEMNNNYSEGVGGAIWAGSSRSNNVYVLNGGEMAYNYSAQAGGAMYAGYCETVKIGGTFKMHDNAAPSYGAIRFHNYASFVMTGGEIYDNGAHSLFLNNNTATITGGKITDSFGYYGGLGLTWGAAEVDGVINYDLATNHNTAYLAAEFNTLKFSVNEANSNFVRFNFKPAAGYTYTEGDEAKLICMNAGYETYWDAATGTFRLQAI